MAKLYISEYISSGSFTDRGLPVAVEPSITTQVVDFSSGEAKSNAFNSQTNFVRIKSDADCHVMFGDNPTATTSKLPLSAGEREWLGVTPGSKLSVIGA